MTDTICGLEPMPCRNCNGHGNWVDWDRDEVFDCSYCDGTGDLRRILLRKIAAAIRANRSVIHERLIWPARPDVTEAVALWLENSND